MIDEPTRTRATLILRLKNWQDHSSWQQFFDTYWRLIYNVALKGGLTEPEAQDVVQETMISVAKNMPGFKYDRQLGSFKVWLLKVTRWRMADQLRRRSPPALSVSRIESTTRTGQIERVMDPNSDALDRMWDVEWEKNLLDAAVANVKRKIDPEKYQIFDFYVNKEWPVEKIAKTFSISVEQVYMARHRITELIKDEVKRLESETM